MCGLTQVDLPFDRLFAPFALLSQPYGLFAVMTGVGGRPVEVIEASYTSDGPWVHVPLRYQVNGNDRTTSLPAMS